MVFMKVTELAAFGFAASDRMKQTSIQNVVVSLLRLAGIVALMATVHPVTLDRWVLVYLLTTLAGHDLRYRQGFAAVGTPSHGPGGVTGRHRGRRVFQHRRFSHYDL